jgi:hypothetical protein
MTCLALFPQIRQLLFDRLHFQFQPAQVGLQFCNLLGFGHVAALEMTAVAAAFTSAMAFLPAIALAFLAVTFLIVMMFTVLAHVRFSFYWMLSPACCWVTQDQDTSFAVIIDHP